MVATFDLVPRVPPGCVIPVMDGTGDRHPLRDHPFPQHVPCCLIFKAVHALVEIACRPIRPLPLCLVVIPIGAREGAHQQPGLTGHRIPPPCFIGSPVGANIRCEIIRPERAERGPCFLLRQDAWQTHLKRPTLPHDLINLAACARIDGVQMPLVNLVHEVVVFKQPGNEIGLAGFKNLATSGCKVAVPDLNRHLLRSEQGCQIETAQPGDRPIPVRVEGVVLVAVNQAVPVSILGDQPFGRFLESGPVVFQKGLIGSHLVFPEGTQDRARLGIDRRNIVELPTKMDRPVLLEAEAEIDLLPHHSLQFRKQTGHGMGIVPHVPACSLTAPNTLPAVEAPIAKPVACGCRQNGGVQECAIQKPVWKR